MTTGEQADDVGVLFHKTDLTSNHYYTAQTQKYKYNTGRRRNNATTRQPRLFIGLHIPTTYIYQSTHLSTFIQSLLQIRPINGL